MIPSAAPALPIILGGVGMLKSQYPVLQYITMKASPGSNLSKLKLAWLKHGANITTSEYSTLALHNSSVGCQLKLCGSDDDVQD